MAKQPCLHCTIMKLLKKDPGNAADHIIALMQCIMTIHLGAEPGAERNSYIVRTTRLFCEAMNRISDTPLVFVDETKDDAIGPTSGNA